MDEIMFSRARSGDRDAFADLLEPLEQKLFRTASAILHNTSDAEDVWQVTILKAWQGLQGLRQPQYFATWITRILLNECKQALRKRPTHLPLQLAEQLPAPQHEREWELEQALAQLNHDQRTIVALRYQSGYQLDEIATILEIPTGTVKTRIYQTLKQLRHLMGEEGSR